MTTDERKTRIREVLSKYDIKAAETTVLKGGTRFEEPSSAEGRYLGIADLCLKFDGSSRRDGWEFALMEMLTDPMLKQ